MLLSRHRAVLTPEPHALIRADQLMLHGEPLHADRLSRWVGEPVPAGSGLWRLPLLPGTGADVLSLLADVRGAVAPVHLIQATPRFRGGPATTPELLTSALPEPVTTKAAHPVTVAVLDTGIGRHPWFVDRPWFADLTPDQFEVLDANQDERLDVLAGHGTFVAGIVAQHAPTAQLRVGRLLGSDGVCDELDLIVALQKLHKAKVDVINLSLGCHTWNDHASAALTEAVEKLPEHTVVVAAAGNDASTRPFWPAAIPGVIAVGALNAAGTEAASFSNHGDWVDACTVGEDVCSAFVTLDETAQAATFARWSGTSFAAPAVTGLIARSIGENGGSPQAAITALMSDSRQEPGLGAVIR